MPDRQQEIEPDDAAVDDLTMAQCHRRLIALARAGAPDAYGGAGARERYARALLGRVEELESRAQAVVHHTIWRTVGDTLVDTQHTHLWPAMYRLTDYGRWDDYAPGDEWRFLGLPPGPRPVAGSSRGRSHQGGRVMCGPPCRETA